MVGAGVVCSGAASVVGAGGGWVVGAGAAAVVCPAWEAEVVCSGEGAVAPEHVASFTVHLSEPAIIIRVK